MTNFEQFAAQAKSMSNSDYTDMTVIGEDLPTNIEFNESIPSSKKVVTNKVSKKSSRGVIETGSSVCYFHTLEQQGSPSAPTVKVCY
jgi:hypothetical protein